METISQINTIALILKISNFFLVEKTIICIIKIVEKESNAENLDLLNSSIRRFKSLLANIHIYPLYLKHFETNLE